MEIRVSRYNSYFTDPWSLEPGVHVVSMEDHRDALAGRFDSHVRLFRSLLPNPYLNSSPYRRSACYMEIYDPLTDTWITGEVNPSDFSYSPQPQKRKHESNENNFLNSVSNSEFQPSADEIKYLDELYYKYGIKTAGKRIGRYD